MGFIDRRQLPAGARPRLVRLWPVPRRPRQRGVTGLDRCTRAEPPIITRWHLGSDRDAEQMRDGSTLPRHYRPCSVLTLDLRLHGHFANII